MKKHLSLLCLWRDVHGPSVQRRTISGTAWLEEPKVFLPAATLFPNSRGNGMLTCVSRETYFSKNNY